MNKLIIALLLGLVVPSFVFADATWTTTKNGRAVTGQQGISNVVAVADGSTGYTQRVDSTGAASVIEKPCTVVVGSGLDSLLVTGAARVYAINVAGTAIAAGDTALIYDALTATGTPRFEISVGTAKNTNEVIIPQGAKFATGIYQAQSADNMLVSVCYDS